MRAIRECGPEAFAHRVLEVCETLEQANEAEAAWIASFSTQEPAFGFNVMPGGEFWGGEHSKATRAIMSKASRVAKDPIEVRAKVSAEARARWADPVERAKQSAAIATGKRAGYADDPTLAPRIQSKRKATLAGKRATRRHFRCRVHGEIPLADCYSKTRANGLVSHECPICVLATQKARRVQFRTAHPIVPPTLFRCATHGDIPFDDCYKRRLPDGRVWHRCKACVRAAQLAASRAAGRRPLAEVTRAPDGTKVCPKCGDTDRFAPRTDGRLGDCKTCHRERAARRRAASGEPVAEAPDDVTLH